MKTINVVFEDKEFKTLSRMKGDQSWHDFIVSGLMGFKQKKL